MTKSILTLLCIITVSSLTAGAQNFNIDIDSLAQKHFSVDSLSNEIIDSYDVRKKPINDYSMIGIQYGVGLTRTFLTPEIAKEDMMLVPVNVGITFTRYGKMFGYMPYFGFQTGFFYTREGYNFRYDQKKNTIPVFLGAKSVLMDVIEVPFLAHCHADFWKMKLILNAGLFVGYRLTIERRKPTEDAEWIINLSPSYDDLNDEYANKFTDFEKRFDYGIKGGLGFGFIFDPVEIHIQAMYKHSFASLFDADYNSSYYYRYSYQQNVIISVGLHFQLGRRIGKTQRQIRREAREYVNGTDSIVIDRQ